MITHIRNLIWQPTSSFISKPIYPIIGSCFYDPGDNKTYFYDGTHWVEFSVEGHSAPNPKERRRKIISIYE